MKKSSFSHIEARLKKPTTKANNERAALIEPFVKRLNECRKSAGYKPYPPGFVAACMSKIATDDLDAFYNKLDQAKNFCSLWHWYCKPKKKFSPSSDIAKK